jgi:hypothetical protein
VIEQNKAEEIGYPLPLLVLIWLGLVVPPAAFDVVFNQ